MENGKESTRTSLGMSGSTEKKSQIHGIPKNVLNSEESMKEGTNRFFAIMIWQQLKASNSPMTVTEICRRVNQGYCDVWESDLTLLQKNTARRHLEAMAGSTFRHFEIRKTVSGGKAYYSCCPKNDSKEAPKVAGKRLLPLAVLDVLLDNDDCVTAKEIGELLGGDIHKSTLHRILNQMEKYTEEYFLEYLVLSDDFVENGYPVRKYFLVKRDD
ncbi:MAG: MarR family transcriptional regulator [Lachnospiraceae bacterium]|nr:MarR family transcriptional regulator [Lachnospiraceae bacterium]